MFFFVSYCGFWSVTGENGVVVGKRKHFCTKVIQQLLEIARGQVGASDAAVEKGVAGEYRLVGMQAETKASCSVARYKKGLNLALAESYYSAMVDGGNGNIFQIAGFKAHHRGINLGLVQYFLGIFVQIHGSLVQVVQASQSRNMVDMGVGEEYCFDF